MCFNKTTYRNLLQKKLASFAKNNIIMKTDNFTEEDSPTVFPIIIPPLPYNKNNNFVDELIIQKN